MLSFKQKKIPQKQLLRLSEWFSQYSYTSSHVKGKNNIVADYLSRPFDEKIYEHLISRNDKDKSDSPMIAVLINDTESSLPDPWKYPPEFADITSAKQALNVAHDNMLTYQLEIFRRYRGLMLGPYGIHPDYPFWFPIPIEVTEDVPKELKWMLWYLFHTNYIAIEFNTKEAATWLAALESQIHHPIEAFENDNLAQILLWFAPLSRWKAWIDFEISTKGQWMHDIHTIFICRRFWYVEEHGQTLHSINDIEPYGSFPSHFGSSPAKEDMLPFLTQRLCQDNNSRPPGRNFKEMNDHVQKTLRFQEEPSSDYKHRLLTAIFMFDFSQGQIENEAHPPQTPPNPEQVSNFSQEAQFVDYEDEAHWPQPMDHDLQEDPDQSSE